jgi:hypothetical protein
VKLNILKHKQLEKSKQIELYSCKMFMADVNKWKRHIVNLQRSHQKWGWGIPKIEIKKNQEIPRWQIEGGSRKCASYSEILERCWRHILQAKPLRRGKTLTPPHLQPVQSISTSC